MNAARKLALAAGAGVLVWLANAAHFAWATGVMDAACARLGGARVVIPIVEPGSVAVRDRDLPDGCSGGACLSFLKDPRFTAFVAQDLPANDYRYPNTGVLPGGAFPQAGVVRRAKTLDGAAPSLTRRWYRFTRVAPGQPCRGDLLRLPAEITDRATYTYELACRTPVPSGVTDYVVVPRDDFALIRSPFGGDGAHPFLPGQMTYGWTIRRGQDDAIMVSAARISLAGSMIDAVWRKVASAIPPFADPTPPFVGGCGPDGVAPTHLPDLTLRGVGLPVRGGSATSQRGVSLKFY